MMTINLCYTPYDNNYYCYCFIVFSLKMIISYDSVVHIDVVSRRQANDFVLSFSRLDLSKVILIDIL